MSFDACPDCGARLPMSGPYLMWCESEGCRAKRDAEIAVLEKQRAMKTMLLAGVTAAMAPHIAERRIRALSFDSAPTKRRPRVIGGKRYERRKKVSR